ncbi:hypothetical protein LAZ67_16000112 [Cordylochernes scorpioides]|uniref:Metalloendopeptidase n=1 Tax=Cordylochernes scorpioides TaxID=51811 RepID=A0ABY6LAB8_9ARAC|nr:hypothetical protein LAZ67_16000112 [Cordylochernes scorpioides]
MAIENYHNKTCLRWVPRDMEPDYVIFVEGDWCTSGPGRLGNGPQYITISSTCLSYTTAVHEMMHAAGFYHEHNRPDRDDYIKVLWENIDPEAFSHFMKMKPGTGNTLGLPYDYVSVVHYHERAFSIDPGRLPSMVPVDPAVNSSFSNVDLSPIVEDVIGFGGVANAKDVIDVPAPKEYIMGEIGGNPSVYCAHRDLSNCGR